MYTPSALLAVPLAAAVAAALTLSAPELRAQAGGRERALFTSVVDREGNPVEGLGPDDFVVREDGVRREVLRVTPATEPIAIAILVDNSQAATNDIRNIREGLTKFVQQMRGAADVAIIGLGDRPTIYQDYTRNAELLDKAIGRLFAQPGSGMQFLEAVVESARGLARRDEPRAVMLPILTDGAEFGNLHYQTVLDALRESGAALHAVTIGTFPSSMNDALRNRATVLDQGPRRSGGQRITLLSSMAVPETLGRLGRELLGQYKVVYGRPESLIQPETVTVTVTRPGLTARGAPERRTPGA
jgi:Ca-activated chloride channel family protein